MPETFTDNDSFCVAPWLHLHVSSTGYRRLCCVSAYPRPKNENWQGYQEFRNSEYMKSIRRQMMSGELPRECASCQHHPDHSYRKALNQRFSNYKKSIVERTHSDGSTDMQPIFLDYRTDICNLSCRTCGEDASRTWQRHLIKHKNVYKEHIGINIDKYEDIWKARKNLQEKSQQEFGVLLTEGDLTTIYFAGGEPTAEANHLEKLAKIIATGQASKIELIYNTNLTARKPFLKKWLSLLNQFECVSIQASIDGCGRVAEYVRSDLNWNRFYENIKYIKENKKDQVRLLIDPTITSVFLSDLKAFSEFCLEVRLPLLVKWMKHNKAIGGHLRVEFLPAYLRRSLVEEWLGYYSQLSDEDQEILSGLKDVLLQCCELEEFPEDDFAKFFQFNKLADSLHGNGSFEQILNNHPLTAEWLKKMKDKHVYQKRTVPDTYST